MDGRQNTSIHPRTKFARIGAASAPMTVDVQTSAGDFAQRGHRDLTLQAGKAWDANWVLRSGEGLVCYRRAVMTRADNGQIQITPLPWTESR
jgi:hypothetical protein